MVKGAGDWGSVTKFGFFGGKDGCFWGSFYLYFYMFLVLQNIYYFSQNVKR